MRSPSSGSPSRRPAKPSCSPCCPGPPKGRPLDRLSGHLLADERVDIGWNWLDRSLWGTSAHLETHFILLHHAFEDLGFGRVQWQLDDLDQASQNAVSRIGGIREGVLRRHFRRVDGSWCDTVYYSLVATEWPAVRDRWVNSWILDGPSPLL